MDLTYFYYQYHYQYYRFLVLKFKLTQSWNKLSRVNKCLFYFSSCFGSVVAGWLIFKLLEQRKLRIDNVETVDDLEDKKVRSKRRQNGIPPGLFNEGNTCFMNCVVQALSSCPSFYKWSCEVVTHYGCSDITLFPSVHKLLKVLTNVTGNENSYSTGDITRSFQSHGWVISREQQDAYEFFQVLISTMEEELCRIAKSPSPSESLFDLNVNSVLSSSIRNKVSKHLPLLTSNEFMSPFKGSFASKLSCLTCGHQLPVKFEMFDSLILSLANMSTFSATLSGCLDEWMKPELLHQVECVRCFHKFGNKYSTFSKQTSLAKLPTCLCIQLQRTTYTPFGTAHKNQIYVKFPELLDLRSYAYSNHLSKEKDMSRKSGRGGCSLHGKSKELSARCSSSQTLYRLNSIVVHFGGTDGGHYITFRRVISTVVSTVSRWFHVSDSFVKVIPTEEALTSTAYLLFYEKVT